MSAVFVTTPFLAQKALKTANSEKCVFCVRRQKCCLGLQIRLFSAENRLQVFAVLRNPYSTPKNLRIPACHRRSHRSDAALLASYATNAALSASETTLPGGGVVNAPAWAGFTTWELLRGREAPLSAALANGDDTLSITADCYSTAGTDAAITAALLAYYTSSQVDTLLGDYRTGTAQDAETAGAITAALLAYYTSSQVDALLGDYRTASAQDTQTQAAIVGALLAYRTGPDQDVFTTNQITSALAAYRSAADQDTATALSIAAALLSYYTIAQVDGLLAFRTTEGPTRWWPP